MSAARSRARSRGAATRPPMPPARTWPTCRARRARTCATPSRRRAARCRSGRARRPTTAARCCTGSREALESRAEELARLAVERQGAAAAGAREELGAAVDTLVHYAGWTDKLAPVMGGINPVAMPYLSFSAPEPTGVVAVIAPDEPDVLGLIREIAPGARGGQHGRRAHLAALAAARARPRRDRRRQRRAGRRAEPAQRAARRAGRTAVRAPRRQRHRRRLGRGRAQGHDRPACGGDRQAREPSPAGGDVGAFALQRLEALTELKTAWHPVGT